MKAARGAVTDKGAISPMTQHEPDTSSATALVLDELKLDDNEQAQRRSQRSQDGSEVRSVELERLIAEGLTLTEQRSAYEGMRDLAAKQFEAHRRLLGRQSQMPTDRLQTGLDPSRLGRTVQAERSPPGDAANRSDRLPRLRHQRQSRRQGQGARHPAL